MSSNVLTYLKNLERWKTELTKLREVILECDLNEDFKWKHPCYTYNTKNIVLIHEFKDYCGLSFFKGALLKDPENLLIQPTENIQSARQMRFTDFTEISELETTIKSYIKEAIEIEKSGLKVKMKTVSEYETPKELEQIFKEHPDFKRAFKKLTPGRQKGYLLHFNKPKQAKTKRARIKNNIQRICDGYGLQDCTCGLSKRKPNCDGSHKQLIKNQL